MRSTNRGRFFGEFFLAALCAGLAPLTAIWPDWIEEAFAVDFDQHNGSLEWLIVASLAVVGVVSGALARIEWLRLRDA
ncbi:MAG: ABC transporter permease [Pseudomonadota bacterium]|nr:ABC transporter permease [Pseudomonadota bacterium]